MSSNIETDRGILSKQIIQEKRDIRIIKDLDRLISIPSVSNTPGEKEIIEYIENEIKEIIRKNSNEEVSISLRKIGREEDNKFIGGLICEINSNKNDETCILMGHVDTVPVNNSWLIDPFKMSEDEEKYYGLGACDMKSGLSLMMQLIEDSTFRSPSINLKMIFTTGEETGIPNGLTEIINRNELSSSDLAIALEPTNSKIGIGVMGYMVGLYEFRGVACHSSDPSRGVNAIVNATKLVDYAINLQKEETVICGKSLKEVFEVTTGNGGTAHNIVPDRAVYGINHRYLPGKNPQEREEFMQMVAEKVGATLHIHEHNPASKIADINSGLLQKFIKILGIKKEDIEIAPFWTDIAQTSKLGINSINYGPGSIEQAHKGNEFVEKKSLFETYLRLQKFIFSK